MIASGASVMHQQQMSQWGSAGTPFSMPLYLNHYAKTHQHLQKQRKFMDSHERNIIKPTASTKSRIVYQALEPRRQYVVPNIFSSYGWGPMG